MRSIMSSKEEMPKHFLPSLPSSPLAECPLSPEQQSKQRLMHLLSLSDHRLKKELKRRGSDGPYWQKRTKNAIANDLANWVIY